MFCMKCGSQLEDDAVFCICCGARLNNVNQEATIPPVSQPVSSAVYTQPEIVPVAKVVEESPVQQPVFQQPAVQQPVEQPVVQQPAFQQPPFQQPVFQQPVEQPVVQQTAFQQPVFQQPPFQQFGNNTQQQFGVKNNVKETSNKKLKSSKATVPAFIFGSISVLLSIMISIYGFMTDGKLGIGIANVLFATTAVFVIMYAVSVSQTTAILKGVGLLATAVVYVVWYAISSVKEATTHISQYFKNSKKATGTDFYYGIVIYILLVCFAIYLIISLIKCFTNSKKVSMTKLVCGYFTMLLLVVVFVVAMVSKQNGLLAFKFIPTTFGLATLILADIFAIVSRAKKMEA